MTPIVWVATVPLKYEVMAVASTEDAAIELACKHALRRLREADAVYPDTNTWRKIREYWGVYATKVTVGTAVLTGNE